MSFIRRILDRLKGILHLQTSPHSIALGFALGTFLAILPTFGFGIVIGGGILLFWKDLSKVSMLVAFAVWNPLLLFPIYSFCYKLGGILFEGLPVEKYEFQLLNQFVTFTRRFLVANLLVALFIATLAYVLLYWGIPRWRNRFKV
ncbi:MAG TPA: DUF2062 domain-containing protein [Candidatus Gracilibacteria bacterium]